MDTTNSEIWKPISGYEGLYEISTHGNVKSLNYNHTKVAKNLKFGVSQDGKYYSVGLFKNNKRKKFRVNRLVAEAFISNPHNYPEVNHKDEDTFNNCVENLEWCTRGYNINYGSRNRKVSEKLKNNPRSKPILAILEDGTIERYPSVTEATRVLEASYGTIWQALNGRIKIAYKRKWEYDNG